MFGEKSRLRQIIEELKAEILRLRELLQTAAERDAQMRRITEQALELAREKQFPQQTPQPAKFEIESRAGSEVDLSAHLSNYLPPVAKNCPQCSVSVRSDYWPQECPACHIWFGEDWPDIIGEDRDGI